MISVPLLKQSIKANGVAWLLVTLATSIMLGILIFVLGNIQSNEIRDSLKDSFIKSELEAQFKSGAIDGFVIVYDTIYQLYPEIKNTYDQVTNLSNVAVLTYDQLKNQFNHPNPKEETIQSILKNTPDEDKPLATFILTSVLTYYETNNPTQNELTQFISKLVIDLIINNMEEEVPEETRAVVKSISQQIIEIYSKNNELTIENMQTIARLYIENSFYDQLGTPNEQTDKMLEVFGYDTIYELLEAFGYNKTTVNGIASSGIIQYISYINNGMEHDLAKSEITKSLFSQMPEDVAESLTELGDMNIDHLVVGTIFYKMAGLLLPIVYVITTANSLIAGQVDSGSLAFVLSTPTKRRKVTITQMIYLIGSLICMYIIIGVVSFIATMLVKDKTFSITYQDLLKLNVGALITVIAISGICFLASAWFNRSKYSVGVGGGLSMFFLVSTILGLFGSSTIPEALRIKAMNFFNYTTIITLFDSEKILSGGTYIYGLLILLGIAIITYIIGIIRFDKKDLPL